MKYLVIYIIFLILGCSEALAPHTEVCIKNVSYIEGNGEFELMRDTLGNVIKCYTEQ